MESLGVKFPFYETYEGGVIGIVETEDEKIKSNLTAFLTLKKGQRPMNNSLYSPLYDYIMETWDEITETNLTDDLKEKLIEFFPEIEVSEIKYVFDETQNLLSITIIYSILVLKVTDEVSISVVLES